MSKKPLSAADLPLELPEPCPACGAKVMMVNARHYPHVGRFTLIHRCECRPYMPEDRKDVRLYISRMTDLMNSTYQWDAR